MRFPGVGGNRIYPAFYVFSVGHGLKMIDPNAARVSAQMIYNESEFYAAMIRQYPRHAMRLELPPVMLEDSVASRVERPLPFDALGLH